MDKDRVVRVLAKGIMAEMVQEAMDIIRKESAKDKANFSPGEWELMEAGAGIGAAAAVNWLYRNSVLKDEIRLPS